MPGPRQGRGPGGNGEKPKDRKKVLKRLWTYLYKYKFLLIIATLLSVSSNLLNLVGPKLSGEAIDAIGIAAGGVNFPRVYFYCILMIIFYILSSLLSYILTRVMIKLSQKITYQMRKDIFNKLVTLPVSFFDSHQTGDIVSRISYDVDTVNASLSNDLIHIVTSIFTVAGSFIMMLVISPPLILVFALTIPMALLFTKYMVKKVRPMFHKRSRCYGELNGFVEEMISGQKAIKSYGCEQVMSDRFDAKNEETSEAAYQAEYYSSKVGPNVNFVNNLSLALISVFGALMYVFNAITPGDLSAFVLYSRRFSGPINEMANIISEIQSACAAAERIFMLIDTPCEPLDDSDAVVLERALGNIDIEHVKFGYTKDKTVIKDFCLKTDKGQLVAIVGHTGAGKTTVINLLMRFYDPDSGEIKIDGINHRKITRASLRKAFAMVLQDTWLFEGTIFDNIAYGKKDASLDDVKKVCKAARISSYIESLSDGYYTVLNENGINISQGQKQLLTIARAMLLDSSMLILDEATSNVDTSTEMQIQAAMRELMKDKTCFVIAHRLSTIQNADIILVMENGDIVEQGTHRELLNKNGVYSRLYYAQFQ